MRRCKKCGRLNPQLATGTVTRRGSDRLMVYEGFTTKPFKYQAHDECLPCRNPGKTSTLQRQPRAGEALTAWLVQVNAREEV